MTPSDFVWQGFMQGKKDGCKEWPMVGESLFSYKGKPLPYMPFCYQHPDYWRIILEESKRTGNMIASRKLFDDSEAAHPITEEEFIKVENIRGKLFQMCIRDRSPTRSRLENCTRRCWKRWCTALAGRYLNKPKGRRNAAFPRRSG